jgi:hypothetical protein
VAECRTLGVQADWCGRTGCGSDRFMTGGTGSSARRSRLLQHATEYFSSGPFNFPMRKDLFPEPIFYKCPPCRSHLNIRQPVGGRVITISLQAHTHTNMGNLCFNRPHNTYLHIRVFTLPKQTPWPLVRKRTIPIERPPLVDEM